MSKYLAATSISREAFKNALETLQRYVEGVDDLDDFVSEVSRFNPDFDPDFNLFEVEPSDFYISAMAADEVYGDPTIRNLCLWADFFANAVLEGKRSARVAGLTCVNLSIEDSDFETHKILDRYEDTSSPIRIADPISVSGKKYSAWIQVGMTPFAFAMLKRFEFDRDHGPWSCDDGTYVLHVTHDPEATADEVLLVRDSVLFELATRGMYFRVDDHFTSEDAIQYSGYEGASFDPYSEDRKDPDPISIDVGPIDLGLREPMRLWHIGSIAPDPYVAILSFVRVIEFVAPTLARRALHDRLRMIVSASKEKVVSASLLDALVTEVHADGFSKTRDADLVKMVVQQVFLPSLIVPLVESLNPKLSRRLASSSTKADAISDLAQIITATRNSLVHAKSNYEPTGKEVAEGDLLKLVPVLANLSELAIRWFGQLSTEHRVMR